jgi:hypothetical protein
MKRTVWGAVYGVVACFGAYYLMTVILGPWDTTAIVTRTVAGLIALVAAVFAFWLGWRHAATLQQRERRPNRLPPA